jgi:hypothetical protein
MVWILNGEPQTNMPEKIALSKLMRRKKLFNLE